MISSGLAPLRKDSCLANLRQGNTLNELVKIGWHSLTALFQSLCHSLTALHEIVRLVNGLFELVKSSSINILKCTVELEILQSLGGLYDGLAFKLPTGLSRLLFSSLSLPTRITTPSLIYI